MSADARLIDLKAITITPGLIDAHVHFAWGGANRHAVLGLSYPEVQRIIDIQSLLDERAGRLPRGAARGSKRLAGTMRSYCRLAPCAPKTCPTA